LPISDDAVEPVPQVVARVEPFLRAENIVAGYQRVPVIHEVSVQVGCGEVVLVMGPNGAGKSTLVKAITGKLDLLSGSVALRGEDISGLREYERAAAGIGYVPQNHDVFSPLTVMQNLAMGGYRLTKSESAGRIEALFEQFPQLAEMRKRKTGTLSGGERKLVGIARALVPKPAMLILDEPTANLAPLIAGSILHEVVALLAADGCAVLLVEQRVRLALEVVTWGYVLASGRPVLDASASELGDMEHLSELFLGSPAVTAS